MSGQRLDQAEQLLPIPSLERIFTEQQGPERLDLVKAMREALRVNVISDQHCE